jgi:hypothetical protein
MSQERKSLPGILRDCIQYAIHSSGDRRGYVRRRDPYVELHEFDMKAFMGPCPTVSARQAHRQCTVVINRHDGESVRRRAPLAQP